MYLGDFLPGQPVVFSWSSNAKTGASITTGIAGSMLVRKGNTNNETTLGITDVRDADGHIGLHRGVIDISNVFYAPHQDYTILLIGSTIDGETVNAVIDSFSILNRSHSIEMKPGTVSGVTSASRFQCADVIERSGSFNNRSVYGGYGSNLMREVGVIQTYTLVGGTADFLLSTSSSIPFTVGERILVI